MNYQKPSAAFVGKFAELVNKSRSIVITAHISPDDDSISSVLLLYSYLIKKWPKKKVRTVYTGEPEDQYKILPDFDKVEFVDDIANHVQECDLFIQLDGNQISRVTRNSDKFNQIFTGPRICLDHHSSAPDKYDLSLIDKNGTSTSELIYLSFFKNKPIAKEQAELALLGILGDTGTFNFVKANQVQVFDSAKRLLKVSQIDVQEFKARFGTISLKTFTLIQEFMKNSQFVSIPGWPKLMYSYLPREVAEKNDYNDSDLGNAAGQFMFQYLRNITDYPWGFIITPSANGDCRLSLRALPGSVNVRAIVEQMGLGGGHDLAAGGIFRSTKVSLKVDECIEKLLGWLKENPGIS